MSNKKAIMSGRSPSPPLNRRLRHHRTGLPSNRSSGGRSFNSSNTANCVPPRLPCYSRANRSNPYEEEVR
uniref:Uncharacterized protein n=1 Tax=Romanomermis culicivorax TaxID=13658 RepID=A0A915JDQ5_ROMCU